MTIQLKLKELLQERGITQKQLSELTGLHESTLSEITRDKKSVINKNHLGLIMKALGITDFNTILKSD